MYEFVSSMSRLDLRCASARLSREEGTNLFLNDYYSISHRISRVAVSIVVRRVKHCARPHNSTHIYLFILIIQRCILCGEDPSLFRCKILKTHHPDKIS